MPRSAADLWAELKRRHVVRVAVAYGVVAFGLMQGADAFLPALGARPWVLSVIAVVLVSGMPIAIVLAWIFDLKRTADGADQSGRPRSFSAGMAGFVAVAFIILIVATAAWIARGRGVRSALDGNALVIIPFRATGDESVTGLREGMIDLLTAKFTGEGGPRAVDQSVVLSKWRRTVRAENEDVTPDVAASMTRALGAGQYLVGDVVGNNGTITMHAAIHDARNGKRLSQAENSGPADSLLVITDRVVTLLLGQSAGEEKPHLAVLTSTSLPAVRSYLAGQARFRRSEYEKGYGHYRDALELDSTFALAAVGALKAFTWASAAGVHLRARRLAWQYRDRLPPHERDYVNAILGPSFPLPSEATVLLPLWRAYLASWPNAPDAWYEFGEFMYHYAHRTGIIDAEDSARVAFRHALTLDPSYAPPLLHLLIIDVSTGDTAALRQDRDRYFEITPDQRRYSFGAWVAATGLHDSAEVARLRAHMDSMPIGDLQHIAWYERTGVFPYQRGRPAEEELDKRTPQSADSLRRRAIAGLMNDGRPSQAAGLALPGRQDIFILGPFAIHPEMDSTRLAAVFQNEAGDTSTVNQCHAGLHQASLAGPKNLATYIAALRRASQRPHAEYVGACAALLAAIEAVQRNAPGAALEVARVDSLLQFIVYARYDELIYATMKLHEALGDYRGALAASTFRGVYDHHYAAPFMLETARLRARLGDKARAAWDYNRYIGMRPNPEPGLAAKNVAAARREFATLMGSKDGK